VLQLMSTMAMIAVEEVMDLIESTHAVTGGADGQEPDSPSPLTTLFSTPSPGNPAPFSSSSWPSCCPRPNPMLLLPSSGYPLLAP
jgi:hypothetical protein